MKFNVKVTGKSGVDIVLIIHSHLENIRQTQL